MSAQRRRRIPGLEGCESKLLLSTLLADPTAGSPPRADKFVQAMAVGSMQDGRDQADASARFGRDAMSGDNGGGPIQPLVRAVDYGSGPVQSLAVNGINDHQPVQSLAVNGGPAQN